MEPRIQYTKTSDGVSIAYAAFGDGPPILFVTSLFGGLHMASRLPRSMEEVDRLVALGWKVVLYDGRGTGSSDRDSEDFSLETRLRDLDAVSDGASLERCALFASSTAGPAAIAYAARNTQRVTHLLLRNTYAAGIERDQAMLGLMVSRALRPVAEEHWEFFTLTLANALAGYADSELAREIADAYRTGLSPRMFLVAGEEVDRTDVSDLLHSLKVPTLVLEDTAEGIVVGTFGKMTRKLASRIPNAQLVTTADAAGAIDRFLREGDLEPRRTATPSPPPGLVTVLFTDVEGSTALTQRLGDNAAREVLREHERVTREALRAHGGSEVKTTGDGFMASFGSATKALECAIAIQRAFAEQGQGVGAHHDAPLRVRIGLNAGEPIAEDDPDGRGDLHGTAVITAARIAALASGGEILVSDVVRQLVAGKGFLFSDRGDHPLKGFEDPVRVYEIRWRESEAP